METFAAVLLLGLRVDYEALHQCWHACYQLGCALDCLFVLPDIIGKVGIVLVSLTLSIIEYAVDESAIPTKNTNVMQNQNCLIINFAVTLEFWEQVSCDDTDKR